MPSEVTTKSTIVVPEVMGDMIDAKITALAKLTPYAKVDTTLVGVAGDTKTVPKWAYVGDAENVAEGDEITTKKLGASTTKFTIGKAMQSIGLTQEAINSGLGDPLGQAESQLAKAIMGKVDNDLLDAVLTASNIYDGTSAVIGYDAIVDAVTKFEDEEDGVEKVMFISPKQEKVLLKDSDFLSADKFQSGVAVNGSIGKIAGCWIKKSKKITKVDAVTAVKAVWTVTIGGTVASGDKFTIHGTEVTLDATSGATPTAAATAIATALGSDAIYDVTRSTAVLTLTEKTGKEGLGGVLVVSVVSTDGTATKVNTVVGVTPARAHFVCPIIKLEADSKDTEFTEDELPALTIFLKADTKVDAEWYPKKQQHDITACKYYGVALTNDSKVVLAKFGETNAK